MFQSSTDSSSNQHLQTSLFYTRQTNLLQNPKNDSISPIILKMSCQFVILILATCLIMEGVLSAPAASDANSLLLTPGDMERIGKATGELENVFKMIRRRKRSLSSFYVQFLHDKRTESTTPYYARM